MASPYEVLIQIVAQGGGDVQRVAELMNQAQAASDKFGKDSAQAMLASAAATKVANMEVKAAIDNVAGLGKGGQDAGGSIAGGMALGTLAVEGIRIAFQLLKASIEKAVRMDGLRVQFALLEGTMSGATERMKQVAEASRNLPFPTEKILDAAAALQKFSGNALRSTDDLKLVASLAITANVPLEQMAQKVGLLFTALNSGQDAKRIIEQFRDLGVLSTETAKKLTDMQDAGQKGNAVWQVAAQNFSQYSNNIKASSDTLSGAFTGLNKSLENLTGTTGVPPKTVLIDFINSLTQSVNLLSFALPKAIGLMGDFLAKTGAFFTRLSNAAAAAGAAEGGTDPATVGFLPGLLAGASGSGTAGTSRGASASADGIRAFTAAAPQPKEHDKGGGGKGNNDEEAALRAKRQLLLEIITLEQKEVDANPFLTMQQRQEKTNELLGREKTVLEQNLAAMQKYVALHQGASAPFLSKVNKDLAETEHKLALVNLKMREATFGGTIQANLQRWVTSFGNAATQISHGLTNIIGGAISSISSGIMGLINGTMTFGQAFAQVGQAILQSLIQLVVQMGVVWLVQQVLGKAALANSAGAIGQAVFTGAAMQAAYAPAAMAASIASYGGAAVQGATAYGIAMASTLVGGLAEGGPVSGVKPGSRDSRDTVPAWLDPQEFVIRREAVQAYGSNFFSQLNNRQLPTTRYAFAGGGPVTPAALGGSGGAGGTGAAPGGGGRGMKLVAVSSHREAMREALRDPGMRTYFVDLMRSNRYVLGIA